MAKVLNINVGCLGHIDSGKTSLAKALSTTASTSSFDKCPQSRERGITIDLGFSSVCVELPQHLSDQIKNESNEDKDISQWLLQLTFVDCPGHSSLIKTIIGGAQIIDLMILVIDITKGIQTQTAECLVIGQITANKMVVVLNKIDLIPADKRDNTIDKMSKRIHKTLEKTKFSNAPIVAVSAKPGGSDDENQENHHKPIGLQLLLDTICREISLPKRSPKGELVLSVDHCFSIRGSGTVMTGTIIQGSVCVNDNIEIPSLKLIKKVKSMQMFKKQIDKAIQGDRVGICVTQFDPKLMERGIVCSPGFMTYVYAVVANVNKIAYYKGKYATKSKFHMSILHETVIAKTTFFAGHPDTNFSFDSNFSYVDEITDFDHNQYYVLLQFERPVILNNGALYIASKLDSDIHANICRLAFYGNILSTFTDKNYIENELQNLKIFKVKNREGIVERVANEYEVIAKNLFKKETNIQNFVGLKVTLSTGEEGFIDGCFGQSGKVKIRIPSGIKDGNLIKSKRAQTQTNSSNTQIKIRLEFKRFIYDSHKKMIQS